MERIFLDKEKTETEKIKFFFKYLVLFFMCEALKENKKTHKDRTWSREREQSIRETKHWFNKNNKILQFYCAIGDIDIDKMFEDYEKQKNKKLNNSLKSMFFRKYKKQLK